MSVQSLDSESEGPQATPPGSQVIQSPESQELWEQPESQELWDQLRGSQPEVYERFTRSEELAHIMYLADTFAPQALQTESQASESSQSSGCSSLPASQDTASAWATLPDTHSHSQSHDYPTSGPRSQLEDNSQSECSSDDESQASDSCQWGSQYPSATNVLSNSGPDLSIYSRSPTPTSQKSDNDSSQASGSCQWESQYPSTANVLRNSGTDSSMYSRSPTPTSEPSAMRLPDGPGWEGSWSEYESERQPQDSYQWGSQHTSATNALPNSSRDSSIYSRSPTPTLSPSAIRLPNYSAPESRPQSECFSDGDQSQDADVSSNCSEGSTTYSRSPTPTTRPSAMRLPDCPWWEGHSRPEYESERQPQDSYQWGSQHTSATNTLLNSSRASTMDSRFPTSTTHPPAAYVIAHSQSEIQVQDLWQHISALNVSPHSSRDSNIYSHSPMPTAYSPARDVIVRRFTIPITPMITADYLHASSLPLFSPLFSPFPRGTVEYYWYNPSSGTQYITPLSLNDYYIYLSSRVQSPVRQASMGSNNKFPRPSQSQSQGWNVPTSWSQDDHEAVSDEREYSECEE
ncbi:hypothetical protein PHLCEN_2v12877 [Hermanssonia centrifuga]|uniref:Uncharacterized protein n=1 Tax=Hermanssonia centrifuga TaxID=98765 RepID=A0A2R6NFS7_9APHY|nr:hypothetical protein PHLCEN_2v12877 [Hermanssonia centrifuga]